MFGYLSGKDPAQSLGNTGVFNITEVYKLVQDDLYGALPK